ncbi:Alpha/Beta hydrolase protein [Lipomyces chichibuensis]|uniref:Alpha/Beta hydrolase protein n=1 Tax=Lipomyces chichibuensis TaxID=1546026 RepID=UPI0033442025
MESGNSNALVNLRNLAKQLRLENNLPEDKTVPIVMVPGFSGWGTPLFGAINYWGGIENIPYLLMERGYTVIVTPVGPISSNWERACELYRQLTFGKFSIFNCKTEDINEIHDVDIDYGNYYNDSRIRPTTTTTKGRKRAILYSKSQDKYENWTWNEDNKVHFICHSQGGNTVRYLISLMSRGSADLHPKYFGTEGRDNWAISVTTLGTPHNGTTIIDVLQNFFSGSTDAAIKLLARLFAAVSFQTPDKRFYDLQLDHWGICRMEINGKLETFQKMRERLESGAVSTWLESNYNGFYDNKIEGVHDLQMKTMSTSNHVYYFSFSFHSTIPFPSQWPSWTIEAIDSFPIPLVDFVRKVLYSIPLVNIGAWIITLILDSFGNTVGWPILLSLVSLWDVTRWATQSVANRLLSEINYNVTLPPPGKYLPRKDVLPLMMPTVYAMGGQDLTAPQRDILGQNLGDWYLNDGIVNTESMRGPRDSNVRNISAFPTSQVNSDDVRGIYWHFGVNDQMDHADEIGVFIEQDTAHSMNDMYNNLAEIISRLSPSS